MVYIVTAEINYPYHMFKTLRFKMDAVDNASEEDVRKKSKECLWKIANAMKLPIEDVSIIKCEEET